MLPPWTPPPRYMGISVATNTQNTLEKYLDVADLVGIERMVVVQPSVFGFNNACTLDAVGRLGLDRARAIVVVRPDTDMSTLRDLDRRGARGIRLNFLSSAEANFKALRALSPALADLGWHIQVYPTGDVVLELARIAGTLPIPLVLDHMAGLVASQGPRRQAYEAAMRLLGEGRAYVKLSAYRASREGFPYDDVVPVARAFLRAAPERCIWGTDWPHPAMDEPNNVPDDGRLVDVILDWLADGVRAKGVLIDNPARLYGFLPGP